MLFTRGRGTIAAVEGEGIVMRMRDRPDAPPLFSIQKFITGINVGALFDSTKHVPVVTITGLEINIPPKGERSAPDSAKSASGPRRTTTGSSVIIDRVDLKKATLVMLPRDKTKKPLRFDIHDVKLESAGPGVAMKYDCLLTNPKPPGEIHSFGSFGPWNSDGAWRYPV